MKIHLTKCAFLSAGLVLAGCSLFTAPMEKPVLVDTYKSDDQKKTLALAVTADRREIVFYPDGVVCMEAPPDVSENISANLTNQLTASAKTPADLTASLQDDIAHQVASAVAYASKPSQGLTFYRNGMAWLCNEFENKIIKEERYARAANEMLHVSSMLIAMEIAVTNGKIGPNSTLDIPPASDKPGKSGADAPAGASDAKGGGAAGATDADKAKKAALLKAQQKAAAGNAPQAAAADATSGTQAGKQPTNPDAVASGESMTGDQRMQMFNTIVDYIKSITKTAGQDETSEQAGNSPAPNGTAATTGTPPPKATKSP